MSEEERMNTYWHIVNNKRLFNCLVDNIPYYFAWMLAVVLMIDVSVFSYDSHLTSTCVYFYRDHLVDLAVP